MVEFDILPRVFLSMQIIGFIGLITMLIVALFGQAPRHSTWYNFMEAWIISCISYSLILLSDQKDPAVTQHTLCSVQAIAVYAAPTLCACNTLSLVIHLWLQVRSSVYKGYSTLLYNRIVSLALLVTPYVAYIFILVEALGFAMSDPKHVTMSVSQMYCVIDDHVPVLISLTIVIMTLLAAVMFEGATMFIIFRNKNLSSAGVNGSHSSAMVIRTISFTLWSIFAVGTGILYIVPTSREAAATRDLLISTLPIGTFVIFGSQADIVRAAMFWRKRDGNSTLTSNDTSSSARPLLLAADASDDTFHETPSATVRLPMRHSGRPSVVHPVHEESGEHPLLFSSVYRENQRMRM